ncbi:uncharacterized protein TRAVEDRAFT_54488 [Trametes versicolor FP-101664 SS1]|uniref:Uncharacterized protein n=1 Tax=Trametes versicolor (strain FP-101664) TaxID=717944 RepID=R7S7G3_TRAVS|nr:uncharacterized protein TRAVEDRAFT_54488 [Trametes versicolor FP-101664 SS1]EIW51552.1 hypothetical protein TRAVEDRAFT_54488 [Trametes versicolor FP-101664 SS1]
MPRRLQFRQFSKTLTTKLRLAGLGRGLRSLGKGISRIPIDPVIVAVETAGNMGSSVPVVQGISSAAVSLLQRAQGVGRNREKCKALAALAESVASAVVDATGDIRNVGDLDEKTLLNLAELEWRMEQIAKTMTRLERKPVWRRFWHKDKHDEALTEHKESLKHALRIFQGTGKCAYWYEGLGEDTAELMKTIKNSDDPLHLIDPGKLLYPEKRNRNPPERGH